MLPPGVQARLDASRWPRPPIFDWLQQHGNVADAEMHRVFNCGIGMVVVVAAERRRARDRRCSTRAGERASSHRRDRRAARGRARRRSSSEPRRRRHRWRSPRITVLISGRGSNLGCAARTPTRAATLDGSRHARDRRNRPDAGGPRHRARRTASRPRVVDHRALSRRARRSTPRSPTRIDAGEPDLVVLAGFMRVLGARVRRALRGPDAQHPSVAAAARIPGLHTHRRALADGVRVHGCTVHFVTPDVDVRPDRRAGGGAGARRRRRGDARGARARGRAPAAAGGRRLVLRGRLVIDAGRVRVDVRMGRADDALTVPPVRAPAR